MVYSTRAQQLRGSMTSSRNEHVQQHTRPSYDKHTVTRLQWKHFIAHAPSLPLRFLCSCMQVFLPSLSHRFMRLSLQGMGRIGAWAGSKEVLALHPDDIVPVAADLDR